jgi:hypothetical protein
MIRFLVVASAGLMLVACQSISNVVPAGNGTYLVGSEVRGGFSSWAEVRALTLMDLPPYPRTRLHP